MDNSDDAKLWSRVDPAKHDVSGGTYLSNFAKQCSVLDNFDSQRASARQVALYTVSAAIRYRDDPMAWELVTQRGIDILFGKLVVPLERDHRSDDRELESEIKKVALVTLCQRPDASGLPDKWFADLECVAAMPGVPAPSNACDCLIDNIVNPHAIVDVDSKLDETTVERAVQTLSKLGTKPTGDSWCVLAMAEPSSVNDVLVNLLEKLGVKRPLPSAFLDSVHAKQFSVNNATLISRAISRLQPPLRPVKAAPRPVPPLRLPLPARNQVPDKDLKLDDDIELWGIASHTHGLLGTFIGASWPVGEDEESKKQHKLVYGRVGPNLNTRLRDAFPLMQPPPIGNVVWYTTHDKKPRTHGDAEHMHKDMVAILSGFTHRIRSDKIGLADVADLLEARLPDLELVARCGPERASIAMLVVHALDKVSPSEVDDLVRLCAACGTALARHGWSLSHLDESINTAVWARVMRLYLHTQNAEMVHRLQTVLGVSHHRCSASVVMDLIKDHLETTEDRKARFVNVFRLLEKGMA